MYNPRYELLDLHGETAYQTGVSWCIKYNDINERVLVFTPFHKLTKDQVSRLRWLYSVITDRIIKISEEGVLTVPVSMDEKFGWILGKVASFYRMAKNDGRIIY
jgi:hypothetical protein